MNGLLDSQTSSNNWASPVLPMLHERVQASIEKRATSSYGHAMFKDMERQILLGETEFQDTLDMLGKKFIFRNTDAVGDFLKTYRRLAYVLLDAAPHMAKAFGEETPLALEIMPEDDFPRTIYALAMWRGERAESRDALKRFDEAWLVHNLKKAAGRIVFDYELT